MTKYSHLTNEELIRQLSVVDDLSELEHELLDRMIQLVDVVDELEAIRREDDARG